MNKMISVALLVLGFTLIATLVAGAVALNKYNNLIAQERGIMAVYQDSQVSYDTFWKKVRETAQVPEKYKEGVKELLLDATKARYEGKDPALLLITEANPTLSPELYLKLQNMIEAGRNSFATTQRTLIDRQRVYATELTQLPMGPVAKFMGFPSEVMGEYAPTTDLDGDGKKTVLDYRFITSEKTAEVFSTGKENAPINVFGE